MNRSFRYVLATLIVLFTLSSCSNKTPKEAKLIPKDASAVIILDPGAMQDKLNNGGISVDTLLSRIFKSDSADEKDKARVTDFRTNAGMNWSNKVFCFIKNETAADKSNTMIMSVIAGLSDADKFSAWIKKQEEIKDKTIEQGKDYSYMMAGKNTVVSWTKENVMVTIYNNSGLAPRFDSTTLELIIPEKKNYDEELKKTVAGFYAQAKDASVASIDAFNNMFKEKADGYFFSSSNSTLNMLSGQLPLSLPKVEELLKDNYSASTLAFENGKIRMKSTTYTNPVLANLLKKYAGPTVDLSLIERYPSNNINGIVLASFNPEIFGGFLKELEVEGMANALLQKEGIQAADLYKCLKGDIAVIISDLGKGPLPEPQERKDESELLAKKQLGKYIFNAPIGDKASFAKLMDKVVEKGFIIKNGNTYQNGELLGLLGVYLRADDKNLIIASDSATYQQYVSNTAKAVINAEVLKTFKDKSTVFYFDIGNTLASFMNAANANGDYDRSLKTAAETFKDVLATSDNFDGKSLDAVFEVRMQNEKQNSLVTLTSLITDIAVDMRVASKRNSQLMQDRLFPAGVPAIIRTN